MRKVNKIKESAEPWHAEALAGTGVRVLQSPVLGFESQRRLQSFAGVVEICCP